MIQASGGRLDHDCWLAMSNEHQDCNASLSLDSESFTIAPRCDATGPRRFRTKHVYAFSKHSYAIVTPITGA